MPLLSYEDLELLCKRLTELVANQEEAHAAELRKVASYNDLLKGELDKAHTLIATLRAQVADRDGEIARLKNVGTPANPS